MIGISCRRPALLVGLILLILTLYGVGEAPPATAADVIEVLGVRTGVEPERTRLVLDLSADGVVWRIAERSEREVVVLLSGVVLGTGVRTDLRDVGRIATGRLAAEAGGELRLTLHLHNESEIKVFTLSGPSRWVLDVRPKSGAQVPARETSPPEEKKLPEVAGRSEPEARPREAPRPEAPSPVEPPRGAEAPPPDSPVPEVVLPPDAPDPTPPPQDLAPLPERKGPRIVVIDAGHGGEDPGATGPGLQEKDVCLDVARRLHRVLSAQGGIHPVLTRSRDVLVPLRQRMQLAEELEADLFVSVHVNASGESEAQGVEVFFLSLRGASDEATRELARMENEAISAEVEDGTGTEADLPFSLSLRQSDTLLRSSRAAEAVLDSFVLESLAENRGVRQASFVVLKSVEVPSILVELGFASSEVDREKLKLEAHRQALADALAAGVSRYFADFAPVRSQP